MCYSYRMEKKIKYEDFFLEKWSYLSNSSYDLRLFAHYIFELENSLQPTWARFAMILIEI